MQARHQPEANIPKVAHRTYITQHLRPRRHINTPISTLQRRWLPHASLPRNGPPSHPNDTDPQDTAHILEQGALPKPVLFNQLRERTVWSLGLSSLSILRAIHCTIRGSRPSPSTVPALRQRVARSSTKQRRRGLRCARRGMTGVRGASARISNVVVHALPDKNTVRDAEVDGDCDDDGDKTRPDATREVCDVAEEPDEEKEEGDGFGVAVAVVFDQLGHLARLAACLLVLGLDKETAHTKRKIQQVKEIEPKRPDAASRGVNGA